jgi:hypothetical protein
LVGRVIDPHDALGFLRRFGSGGVAGADHTKSHVFA